MTEFTAYFDGAAVQVLEDLPAKKNQLLKITLTDKYLEDESKNEVSSLRGYFQDKVKNPNPTSEKDAWPLAVKDKYEIS